MEWTFRRLRRIGDRSPIAHRWRPGGRSTAGQRATVANSSQSLEDVHSTASISYPGLFRRLFAFMGPAYLISVGYMDPGNWATDIEGALVSITS